MVQRKSITTFFKKPSNSKYLSWKGYEILRRYTTRFGNLKPRKFTKLSVSQQKKVRQMVIRARELGVLPYIR